MGLKRSLASALVLLAGVVAMGEAFAQPDFRFGPPGRPGPGWPGPGPGRQRDIVLEQNLNLQVRGYETIAVRQVLGIGPQYRGYDLKSVTLYAEAEGGWRPGPGPRPFPPHRPGLGGGHFPPRPFPPFPPMPPRADAEATLLVDGGSVGYPQYISAQGGRYEFILDRRNNDLGEDIRRVELELRGQLRVTRIAATLSLQDDRPGRPDRVRLVSAYVGRQFGRGWDTTLEVRQALNLGLEDRGTEIEFVEVAASSRMGYGQAQLLLDGMPYGAPQTLGQYSTRVRFDLPPYADNLGREVQRLQVSFQGDIFVDSVAAGLSRGGFGHGHGPGPGPGIHIGFGR